jgi:hypothetical protein
MVFEVDHTQATVNNTGQDVGQGEGVDVMRAKVALGLGLK